MGNYKNDFPTVDTVVSRSNNKKKFKRNAAITMAFFTVSFFWQEMFTRLFTFKGMTFSQFIIITVQCLVYGMAFSFIVSFLTNKKALHIIIGIISGLTSLVFSAQIVYFKQFSQYFAWDTVGMAGQLKDYIKEALLAILLSIPKIIIVVGPFILFILFKNKYMKYKKVPNSLRFRVIIVLVIALIFGLILKNANKDAKAAYNDGEVNIVSQNFGILTSSRLGLHRVIFGDKDNDEIGDDTDPGTIVVPPSVDTDETTSSDDTSDSSDSTEHQGKIEYGDNVLDIDFDALIEANKKNETITKILKYFKSQTPTKKNKYTGYFEGKNLIFISLEAFCGEWVTEEIAPTLYKMMNSGFVFTDFYNSCWGGSTATGEYANLTGMFYNSAKVIEMSGDVSFPFTLGNQLLKQNYNTFAFHANTATYYHRELGYPSYGYQTYYGKGATVILDPKTGKTQKLSTGIEEFKDSHGTSWTLKKSGKSLWPESDYELAHLTVDKYIDAQPFHVYYMSISGHCNYNWGGNSMCIKHQSEVQNLGYKNEDVQAYVACQIEVELMLKELVDRLSEAGILDNTVFVLSADHYPYGLSDEGLAELYNLPVTDITKNFELYRNNLVIWNSAMTETVTINKPCSTIDILPTVSNLFGLDYDSRMMAGVDLLSDAEPIVIMNCVSGPYWGWITKYGYYKGSTFYANEDFDWGNVSKSSYAKSISSIVNNKHTYFFSVLKNNFFSYLNLK